VAVPQHDAADRAAYWPFAIVRAVPAAAFALVITFSADHSAHFGLVAFGAFAIVSGITLAVMAWLRLSGSRARSFFLTQAVVTVVAGIASLLALSAVAPRDEVRYLFLIVTFFAAITGLLELYSGLRTRRRYVASGDWIAVGASTVVVAIAFLLIPPAYSQTFTGPDHIKRVLDSAVVAVGLLGAYGAIVAVYLLIAGFSAKWGTQTPVTAAETSTNPSPIESETSA
jgi:uncharacterized membrane protein HdeD (DUF308 family)